MSKKTGKKLKKLDWKWVLVLALVLFAAGNMGLLETDDPSPSVPADIISLEEIPEFSNSPYVIINNHEPFFAEEEMVADAYEAYSDLDVLGRCGAAAACVGRELMPTEDRESISSVKPTGWVNKPYDFVDGEYLYNRCHLIGFQLTGENANERNLITGTRYMNVQGMLPFENMVADHIKEEDHHVLYRVTPIFEGDNLVASGVLMEALCVECHETEDEDDDLFFNVYCYNVQPGVVIDYATGDNRKAETVYEGEAVTYILNTSSKKFHSEDCSNAVNMKEENRSQITCTRQELIDLGYSPAGCCNP